MTSDTSARIRRRVDKPSLVDALATTSGSGLKRYRAKCVGSEGIARFLSYELVTSLLGSCPGGLGYFLRKAFYPHLLRRVGSGIILGKGLTLRHPSKITLGARVAIDDYGLLDASGAADGEGIVIGDEVIISRNCVVQAKLAPVTIGRHTDIGCNCTVSSISGVHIGESVLMGANCYVGGARYIADRPDIPMMQQGAYTEGPVTIGDDVWLGAGVTVIDGVTIGRGCIVGAGAVVTQDLPDYAVAVGVPARIIRSRLDRPTS